MVGHASHPEVLERAGAQDADMLIAVTRSDGVNMVACQVAYSLSNVSRRIARICHSGYLERKRHSLYASDASEHFGIATGGAIAISHLHALSRSVREGTN
jgi:Trk K+ transport system NAD-binding subunit